MPDQCPLRIDIVGDLAPRIPSFVVERFARILCEQYKYYLRVHRSSWDDEDPMSFSDFSRVIWENAATKPELAKF